MAVAKSFEKMEITSGPYADAKGKSWVRVKDPCGRCNCTGTYVYGPYCGTCFSCDGKGYRIKEVRWYSDEERTNLDAKNEARAEQVRQKREAEILRKQGAEYNGFQNGYVIAIYGDTYSVKDELKEAGARFNHALGWYFSDEEKVPEKFISQSVKITWEMVSKEGRIMFESDVKDVVYLAIPRPKSHSEYQGHIGDRLCGLKLKVTKFWDGGDYCAHTMEDMNGNVYTWVTSSRAIEVGKSVYMDATVKKHEEYNGVKQTRLTRPSIKEIA